MKIIQELKYLNSIKPLKEVLDSDWYLNCKGMRTRTIEFWKILLGEYEKEMEG